MNTPKTNPSPQCGNCESGFSAPHSEAGADGCRPGQHNVVTAPRQATGRACESAAQGRAGAFIYAYDHEGFRKARTPVYVGDIVEWKRDGALGTYKARVERIYPFTAVNGQELCTLSIRPFEHDGIQLAGKQRARTVRFVSRVYDPEGRRRSPC